MIITNKYGETTTITNSNILIGKDKNCGFRINDNTGVARIHAKLNLRNSEWYLTDLNSANGTFWNGIRLSSGKEKKLSDNDKLCFANSEYIANETEDRAKLKKQVYAVRRRVREKAAEIERYGSEKDKKILEIINELVFDDFCYIKLDIKLAFQTRYFLGYSKKEAQDLYIELVQASVALSNKGRYTQVEKK